MLVHICCSVDSHYFLTKLKALYPNKRLVGYFYDPNIHPYSEYRLRLEDVKRSCKLLDIELVEGPYAYDLWLQGAKGLAQEPEKGKRCDYCFEMRFEKSAQTAKALGLSMFTSTLLLSPKKSISQLNRAGEKSAIANGLEFLSVDFRTKGGTQEQNRLAKNDKLYRQNYCGCLFALKAQRQQQHQTTTELSSPLCGSMLPGSIESRIELYNQRAALESQNIGYEIVKKRILNYRINQGFIKDKTGFVPTFFLPFSTLKRGYSRGRLNAIDGYRYSLGREELFLITLSQFNSISKQHYCSLKELFYAQKDFDELCRVKQQIEHSMMPLSAVGVVESIPEGKIEIRLDAVTFEDVIDELIKT